ncbi:MAG: pentapeptide repeat-containing protein [Nostoc sp.]|uniref:pentapeptide repeat-containing protein n=1 Tax=Nostoc sp. TaxID=1180 RepID=UPI002FFA8C91
MLTTKKCPKCDLGGADLTNADLAGADLREAELTNAKLDGANLEGADLTKAELRWRDDVGDKGKMGISEIGDDYCNVTYEASFKGANLSSASLGSLNLQKVIYNSHTIWRGASYNEFTQFLNGFNSLNEQMEFKRLSPF